MPGTPASAPGPSGPWTPRDQTLLRTAQIMYAIEHGEYDRIDGIPVDFGLAGDYPDNRIVLAAPFEVLSFEAVGDGSYQHDSGFFFATGQVGLAITAGAAIGRAVGNSRRRQQAAQAATPQWHVIDQGMVHVNQFGLYLRTPTDLLEWDWESIITGRMIERGQFAMLGESAQGRVNYVIVSDAAELIFAFWATVRQPQHPQLAQRIWLLPEWVAHHRAHFGAQAFDFTEGRASLEQ